ncbi:hypothetical protein Patl1_12350 [Pistacia atlantica]|uniref:Uncharacterized protein n=1 Tax=Pistacia atlantica TaxID=434234 RepID=A0ACC1AA73_9ROSI|nr:hypothetical protein Patl1_12350 [Pistacia atlantica]
MKKQGLHILSKELPL